MSLAGSGHINPLPSKRDLARLLTLDIDQHFDVFLQVYSKEIRDKLTILLCIEKENDEFLCITKQVIDNIYIELHNHDKEEITEIYLNHMVVRVTEETFEDALCKALARDITAHFPKICNKIYEKQHRHIIWKIIHKIAPDDIDDAYQHMLMNAFNGLQNMIQKNLMGQLRLKAWLHIVAKNTALKYIRDKTDKLRKDYKVDSIDLPQQNIFYAAIIEVPDNLSPEAQALIQERLAQIRKIIQERCSPQDQRILDLYLQEWSYKEIAATLQMKENDIRTHLHSIRKIIRRYLDK